MRASFHCTECDMTWVNCDGACPKCSETVSGGTLPDSGARIEFANGAVRDASS